MNIQKATLNKQYPNNIDILFVIFLYLKTRLEKMFYNSNFLNYLIGVVWLMNQGDVNCSLY